MQHQTPASLNSSRPFQRADWPWEPGSVVELPLLVSGQTVGHLECLANQKGLTVGSFIRALLDEGLAREYPDGLPVRSGPGGFARAWMEERPAE